MVGALWTGISGLGGSQIGLDNESNNIANVNTIGYKASRVSFADQMYQDKIGKGVTSFDVEKMYTQGNLKITGVSYDMALSGDGFFQVKNGNETYYTRAGNFRMGEGGKLEDVGQNTVQGWAIQPVTPDDITSTDPNATYFTSDFTKLLGNRVIRDTTTIETIVAKATDYTQTATTDNPVIFTGAGYKSASTKIADVEALITEYNSALAVYSEADPKPTASSSSSQKDLLNYDLAGKTLAEGDEVYIYIDGVKYSQSFDTDNATTMKKFADKLSDTPGFKAYVTDDIASPFDVDTQTAPGNGYIVIEGIVPGQQYRVTELGWTDASNSNLASKGTVTNVQPSVLGTGMGHINSVKDALAEAVSGKQMDVYTTSILAAVDGVNDFAYQIEIYDKNTNQTVTIPTVPLDILAPANVDDFVAAINANTAATDELADYVKAYNINGSLVIKTLDDNYDVEFTGTMTGPIKEIQNFTIANTTPTAGNVAFAGESIALAGTETTDEVGAAIVAHFAGVVPTATVESVTYDPTTDTLTVTYLSTAGDVAEAAAATSNGVDISAAVEVTQGALLGVIARDPNYSGREGAGAEFLQINTMINQTASRSDIQLRLDTLGLTDSAFGDFEVDSTGLITMTQDGARFAIGQVAVARFTDNRGLDPVGDNLLMETTRSGAALFNINNDKMAEIQGSTLELSTADLSESLVNLMVFQRAFEANAKSITTADSILTTLIQLKQR